MIGIVSMGKTESDKDIQQGISVDFTSLLPILCRCSPRPGSIGLISYRLRSTSHFFPPPLLPPSLVVRPSGVVL